jgi:hypothetical protein
MSSILDKIQWARNPLSSLPQAAARARQARLAEKQFEAKQKAVREAQRVAYQEAQQKAVLPTLEFAKQSATQIRKAFEAGGFEAAAPMVQQFKQDLGAGLQRGDYNLELGAQFGKTALPQSVEEAMRAEQAIEAQIARRLTPEQRTQRAEAVRMEQLKERQAGVTNLANTAEQMERLGVVGGRGELQDAAAAQASARLSAQVEAEAAKPQSTISTQEQEVIQDALQQAGTNPAYLGYAKRLLQSELEPERKDRLSPEMQGAADILLGERKLTAAGAQNLNLLTNHPEYPQAVAKWREQQASALAEERMYKQRRAEAAGKTVILERGTRTGLQKDLISDLQMMNTLDALQTSAKPEMFTLQGRVGNKLLSIASHISPTLWGQGELVDSLQARKVVNNDVEQFFQAYRKYITGAQAGLKEIEMLKNSMLNMELSWPEFQASLKQLNSKIGRTIRLRNKILSKGLDLSDEEIGRELDAAWMAGDQANSRKDRVAREKALLQGGMTDPDLRIKTLLAEGYISEKQAKAVMKKLAERK